MTFYKFLLIPFGILLLSSTTAIAQDYGSMSPAQLLREMEFNVNQIHELDIIAEENLEIASRHQAKFSLLENELIQLDYQEANYASELNVYESEVYSFEGQCQGELEEAAYNRCTNWLSQLDYRQSQLDNEYFRLDAEFDDYNRRADDLNMREENRVWAAQQVLKKYDDYEQNIKQIKFRLVQLGTIRNLENFNNQNRDCASLPSLEDMHQCMQNLWDGARR